MPRAMGSLECLQWCNFIAMSDDFGLQTEGKTGVPRYDGDVAKLTESCSSRECSRLEPAHVSSSTCRPNRKPLQPDA